MKRAAIYLRISEDRTGEGLAVDRQREDCRNLATPRGWTIVEEYVDNDVSAAGRKTRPSFLRLVADVRAGNIDVIVAWSLDRIVRTPRDRLALVEACRARNTSVALVRGSDMDLTTAAGRLFAGMLGEVAQHEIDVKGERQTRQSQQAAEAGRPGGGPRAFGYLKGGMDIHPVEGPVVADMYHRFLAGAGLGELVDRLNRAGHLTPRGMKWRPGSVKVVLSNPRNAGLRGIRPVVDKETGRRSQWHDIIAPAIWPGVVDEATWRATMHILQDPARLLGPHPRSPGAQFRHLLSGITRCGRCGLPMVSSSGGGKRTYRCSAKMHIVRGAARLETYVTGQVLLRLREPDAVDLLGERKQPAQVDEWRHESLRLRAELTNLAVLLADRVLDASQVKVAGDRYRAKLAEVEAQLAAAGSVNVLGPIVLAADDEAAWQVWTGYPVSTQRLVIERLMRVTILQGRPGRPVGGGRFDTSSVTIEWLTPT